jgi:hypothetical protein
LIQASVRLTSAINWQKQNPLYTQEAPVPIGTGARWIDENPMNRQYYTHHLLIGCIYLIAVSIAWSANGDAFYESPWLVAFMVLSTLFYPCARYLVQASAYRVTGPTFWTRGFFIEDANSPGLRALFSVLCILLAIPLGVAYVLFRLSRKG